jgi:hypothetical protein
VFSLVEMVLILHRSNLIGTKGLVGIATQVSCVLNSKSKSDEVHMVDLMVSSTALTFITFTSEICVPMPMPMLMESPTFTQLPSNMMRNTATVSQRLS